MDALYAFTNCEVSISPLCCIIENNKPIFIGVSEVLKRSTDHTVDLLKKELEIQLMADDAMKLQAMQQLLREKIAKRKVSVKSLDFQDSQPAGGDIRQWLGARRGRQHQYVVG